MSDYCWKFKTKKSLRLHVVVGNTPTLQKIEDIFGVHRTGNTERNLIMHLRHPNPLKAKTIEHNELQLVLGNLISSHVKLMYRCHIDEHTLFAIKRLSWEYAVETFDHLFSKYRSITKVTLSQKPSIEEIRCIAKILMMEGCTITKLKVHVLDFIGRDGTNCLMSAISKNGSLRSIVIDNAVWKDYPNQIEFVDDFVSSLAMAIKFHPCLKELRLTNNDIPLNNIIRSIPSSLVFLNIDKNNTLTLGDVIYVARNTRIKSFKFGPFDETPHAFYNHGKATADQEHLLASKSLTEINELDPFHECTDDCIEEYDDDDEKSRIIVANICTMLRQNRKALNDAKQAALCLISIHKFRKSEVNLFGKIPNELVRYIAEMIVDSYIEEIWREPDKKSSKRHKHN